MAKILEEKPKIIKKKKLPMNYVVDEFMEQQLVTLDKLKKGGNKNDDTNADGSTN